MIKTGIVGGESCVAGELIRLLVMHPEVELKFVQSETGAAGMVADWHPGLEELCELSFVDEIPLDEINLLFFCTEAGIARKFMDSHNLPENLKIIDLSADFRISGNGNDFEYGLPELNRRATCKAKHVANPGACATAVTLGLLPLAKYSLLDGDVTACSIVGCSELTQTSVAGMPAYGRMYDNVYMATAFEHPDLAEIKSSLLKLQDNFTGEVNYLTWNGGFARGIFTTIVVRTDVDLDDLIRVYKEYYKADSFVYVVAGNLDLKQVVGTNKCLIHLEKHGNKLVIVTCIDNLLKGAAGQAVHNMNLLFNLEETVGLQLKASVY